MAEVIYQGEAGNAPSFPLAIASEGDVLKIVFVRGGRKREERLLSMGLKVDDVITVKLSRPGGGKIVLLNDTRYALGAGMAHYISVVKV